MMKIFVVFIIGTWFISCNNPGNTNTKKVDTIPTDKDVPEVPPKKVMGSFTGLRPCKGCTGTEVLLKLTDTSYWKMENFKDAKDKSRSLAAETGRCIQENGVIHLLSKNDTIETYKILSRDSLQLITRGHRVKENKAHYFLIRRNK